MELNNVYMLIEIIIGALTIFGIIFASLWKWCPIPPGHRTTVSICLIMKPNKMPEKGVGIVDQFGKQYWVKNVMFRPTP